MAVAEAAIIIIINMTLCTRLEQEYRDQILKRQSASRPVGQCILSVAIRTVIQK